MQTAPETNKLPGFGLPIDYKPDGLFPNGLHNHKLLTVRERTMEQFMNSVTDKQDWQIKVHDQNITDKWYQEILAQDFDMSDKMFERCIAELKLEKAQELESSGIVRVYDLGVFKSDSIVDKQLRDQLNEFVFPLENTPIKDWHPGSNEMVLDLVHPAMYPLVYGRSKILQEGKTNIEDCVRRCGEGVIIPKPEKKGKKNQDQDIMQIYFREPELSYSYKYQWLPCEVSLDNDRTQITSYINNLHPQKYPGLYTVVEQIIDRVIPMWNRCLSMYTAVEMSKRRIDDIKFEYEYKKVKNSVSKVQSDDCEDNGDNRMHDNDKDDNNKQNTNSEVGRKNNKESSQGLEFPDDYQEEEHNDGKYSEVSDDNKGSDNEEDEDNQIDEKDTEWFKPEDYEDQEMLYKWDESDDDYYHEVKEKYGKILDRRAIQPEPKNYSTWAERAQAKDKSGYQTKRSKKGYQPYSFVNLREKKELQIIVKLANIELTPEKPTYEGGTWHIEGQLNEHICASAIYYYDQENITESRLSFRGVMNQDQVEDDYLQDQHAAPEEIYGFENQSSAVLSFGDVVTKQGRIVAFPNTMQHQVQPFSLQDPARPGHRKILALFLVDPHIKVISTAHIPCQQAEWWQDYVKDNTELKKLPKEIQQEIMKKVEPITKNEAEQIRQDLIEERKAFVLKDSKAANQVTFSLCEH